MILGFLYHSLPVAMRTLGGFPVRPASKERKYKQKRTLTRFWRRSLAFSGRRYNVPDRVRDRYPMILHRTIPHPRA